jgi:anthraniloyl-CoA monooxygenase
MFAPLRSGKLAIANRVALAAGADLAAAAASGAGLVISEFVSVAADGRITPETPVIDRDYQQALQTAAREVHRLGARLALQLGHAGRRGSTRSRREGVDRPLQQGGWKLLAPSAIAYTPHAPLPKPMTTRDIEHAVKIFATAARVARECDVDILELNMAHGYLFASFISPLTNKRDDEYGGSFQNRMRFPLEGRASVRSNWDRSLLVKISASDWLSGGLDLDEGVEVARQFKAGGADVIHAVMGQTVWESRPDYRPLFGVPASDRIRNEAGIPTLAEGNITTSDDVNTIVAAGRADLCLLELRGLATK